MTRKKATAIYSAVTDAISNPRDIYPGEDYDIENVITHNLVDLLDTLENNEDPDWQSKVKSFIDKEKDHLDLNKIPGNLLDVPSTDTYAQRLESEEKTSDSLYLVDTLWPAVLQGRYDLGLMESEGFTREDPPPYDFYCGIGFDLVETVLLLAILLKGMRAKQLLNRLRTLRAICVDGCVKGAKSCVKRMKKSREDSRNEWLWRYYGQF